MQIQKNTCKNRASQQNIGPSCFDGALVEKQLHIFLSRISLFLENFSEELGKTTQKVDCIMYNPKAEAVIVRVFDINKKQNKSEALGKILLLMQNCDRDQTCTYNFVLLNLKQQNI